MGWAVGYDENWGRDIGYGVPAVCDHPQCSAKIDRGLSYVCGNDVMGGERGCGLYFCSEHLTGRHRLCERCACNGESFDPKPDVEEWTRHKMTDPSWAAWRKANNVEQPQEAPCPRRTEG